jgi:hypothetical protein
MPSISSTTKKLTVNTKTDSDTVFATMPFKCDISNIDIDKIGRLWKPYSYRTDDEIAYDNNLRSMVDIYADGSNLVFYLWPNAKLEKSPRTMKVDIEPFALQGNVYTHSLFFKKPLSISFTATDKGSSSKVSVKNKIDIVKPETFITATATFTNTASPINTGISPILLPQNDPANASGFIVDANSGTTFTIRADPTKNVVPGVAQKFKVRLALENGETVDSSNVISITPSQTAGKAFQSTKAVSLYQSAPGDDAEIGLNFTSPAGMEVAEATIDPASVKSFLNGGFELIRNGANNWSLGFKGDEYPELINNKGELLKDKNGNPKALAASYNIKLQLWAPNTYQTLDSPIAIGNVTYEKIAPLTTVNASTGKHTAKSKPTTVTVKVTIVKDAVAD